MRKQLDDLKLNIECTVTEMPPDQTTLLPFREFVPGLASATLDGVFLSESETEAVRKVIYAAAY